MLLAKLLFASEILSPVPYLFSCVSSAVSYCNAPILKALKWIEICYHHEYGRRKISFPFYVHLDISRVLPLHWTARVGQEKLVDEHHVLCRYIQMHSCAILVFLSCWGLLWKELAVAFRLF